MAAWPAAHILVMSGDASSLALATTLAQLQQNERETHHITQQIFLNPVLPVVCSYTSLLYYMEVLGLPSTFQYGPTMFPMAPTSFNQHSVNVSVIHQPTLYSSQVDMGLTDTTLMCQSLSNTSMPDMSGSLYSKIQHSFEKQYFHSGTPTAPFNLPPA